jgi:hypothetical protein
VQLEGSIKSAQVLFARYDMDLDQRLRQQDYYDLMLELALALPYQEYQRFVDASFEYVGGWVPPECQQGNNQHLSRCLVAACSSSLQEVWRRGGGRGEKAAHSF